MFGIVTIGLYRQRMELHSVVISPWNSQMHDCRDLRSDAVKRERGNEADSSVRRSYRNDGEVRVREFLRIGQAIESARQFRYLPAVPEAVERCWMNAERKRVLRTE